VAESFPKNPMLIKFKMKPTKSYKIPRKYISKGTVKNSNTGPKIFWSSYKKLLNNKKNTNIPPISVEGIFISNFKEKAKIFNKYFAEQCQPLENASVLPDHIDYQTNNRIGTVKIEINEIVEVIKN